MQKAAIFFSLLIALFPISCSKKEVTPEKSGSASIVQDEVYKETPLQLILLNKAKFTDQRVLLVGKAYQPEGFAKGAFYLMQYFTLKINDKEEQKVLLIKVNSPQSTIFPFNSWIRVQGMIRNNGVQLTLDAESVQVVSRPRDWVHPDYTPKPEEQ
ncbi:MAG: hypothetical protein A2293_06115 [Elusimicrobia bacterium RIFOXYB2_FULL_49_7]|nr:MAG: hypothetical protein A2293_06115 [Elusimicrobia bacterium RIFOXYB2_FULL_49_7]